jgi:hypothetical protein
MVRVRPTRQCCDELSFQQALSQVLCELSESGQLSTASAWKWRYVIRSTPRTVRRRVLQDPEALLGSFESLPDVARRAIVSAIVNDDKWSVRGYEFVPWHFVVRLLFRFRLWLHLKGSSRSKDLWTLKQISDVLAYGSRMGLGHLVRQLHHWWLRKMAKLRWRPILTQALALAGIEPRQFAVCYARDIPQLPPYRGFWHDQSKHNTVGVGFAIDFIRSSDGYWFIESNLPFALAAERIALYDRDPFVVNMLEFTKAHGYRHLIVMDNGTSGVVEAMARQYEEEAAARGITLTIVQRFNVPGSRHPQSYGIPPFPGDGTLVVRLKSYPTSLDDLIRHKRATGMALERFKQMIGDSDLRLPTSSVDPVLGDVAPDEPFPNVVYKLPEVEQGRGVFFLKVTSPEHARDILNKAILSARRPRLEDRVVHRVTSRDGLFQPYIKSLFLPHRRLYKIRAHGLITPVGNTFLSAHRDVLPWSVPEKLDMGIVKDPKPYFVNMSAGAKREILPPEEEPEIARATLAVARGLAWAIEYSFRTTDTPQMARTE